MTPIENNIIHWIETYDFNDLSSEQKAIVRELSSEIEYQQERSLVLSARRLFDEEELQIPDASLKGTLDNRFQSNNKRKGRFVGFKKVITHPVPAYQVAAACFLLFMSSFLFIKSNKNGGSPNESSIVYRTVYDTIVQQIRDTIEVPVETIVVQTVYKKNTNTQKKTPSLESTPIINESYVDYVPPIIQDDVQKSIGNTSIQQHELEQFRVSM